MRALLVILVAATVAACSGSMLPTGAGGEPDADPGATLTFRPAIQADLEASGCAVQSCHGGGSIAMHVTASPADDAAWQANYEQVIAFAGTVDQSPLIDMATGVGGHVPSLASSDVAVQRWAAWIAGGAPYEPAPAGDADAGATGGTDGGAGGGPGFAADVEPVLEKYACGACHGTAGNYSVASYQDTFGSGTDSIPNVIAGDASSLLVTYVAAGHDGVSNQDVRLIERWVVDGLAAP